ncbi:MAG: energy-coupling factor transport system permease protein [Clostridia bacterium]|nr:energy-coupling factor transport system permease protein [Clostridia bacterium]
MYLEFGQYFPGRSIIHTLDPRAKIGGLLLYSVALVLAPRFSVALEISLPLILAAILAGVPGSFFWRQVKPLLPFLALALVFHAALTPGQEILFTAGPFAFSREGAERAALACLRVAGLVLGAGMVTATTSPLRLTDGLEAILKPARRLGLPVQEMALMLSLAVRFIPLLLEEAAKIRLAQEARGADFSGRLEKRLKLFMAMAIPLFISIFRRAEDIAQAMEARCYRADKERTRMHILRLRFNDYIALALGVFLLFWSAARRWL